MRKSEEFKKQHCGEFMSSINVDRYTEIVRLEVIEEFEGKDVNKYLECSTYQDNDNCDVVELEDAKEACAMVAAKYEKQAIEAFKEFLSDMIFIQELHPDDRDECIKVFTEKLNGK